MCPIVRSFAQVQGGARPVKKLPVTLGPVIDDKADDLFSQRKTTHELGCAYPGIRRAA